jgi:hypothetical protein
LTLLVSGCVVLASCATASNMTKPESSDAAAARPPTPPPASSPGAHPPSPALATDPVAGADRCTGYSLDGVSVGMVRSRLEQLVGLMPLPPLSPPTTTPPAGAAGATESKTSTSPAATTATNRYSVLAIRRGRKDEVEIDFSPIGKDPAVTSLKARIFVAPDDPWPYSLFRLLGSPKRAIVDEWIWWDDRCAYTLRLTKVDKLGSGAAEPYILEIKHISQPF